MSFGPRINVGLGSKTEFIILAKIKHQLANQIFSRLKDLEFNHTRIKLLAGYFKDK